MKISEILCEEMDDNDHFICDWKVRCALKRRRDPDHSNMSRMIALYRFDEKGEITETINLEKSVDELVEMLYHTIDVKEFLRQKLEEEGALNVEELANILKKHPEAAKEAKSRQGCLYIQIPNPEPGKEDYKLFLKGD